MTNRRILLIDDMPTIHDDFRKILAPQAASRSALDATKAALFGDEVRPLDEAFELDSAYQGAEGLAKVRDAMREERPYAMAFIDMRMPPGWDGAETVERLWEVDPRLQVVICTAYSDTSWEEVLQRLDTRDRLLILKKPFDNIEVWQLASALTAKWTFTQHSVQQTHNLQNRLAQSQKLAELGQLAAGVAQEISQPIGQVFSKVSMLEAYLEQVFEVLGAYEDAERQLPAEVALKLCALRERLQLDYLKDDAPQLLRQSKDGIARVRKVVQDLRDFSRADSTQGLPRAASVAPVTSSH